MIGACGMHHLKYFNGLFILQEFVVHLEDLGPNGFYLEEKNDHIVNAADAVCLVTTGKHALVMFLCSFTLLYGLYYI